MSRPQFIVAQIGARRHYAVPAAFARAGMLARFYTDLHASHPLARLIGAVVPEKLRPNAVRSICSRKIDGVPSELIRTLTRFAVRRVFDRSRNEGPAEAYRRWASANRSFCKCVAHAGLGDADGVYVFNGAGLEILEQARSMGLKTIVDQTDAPFPIEERLLQEERERWPGWETTAVTHNDWQPMADRERAEWELADGILCGSDYVRDGVRSAGGPYDRCRVVPYGYGTVDSAPSIRVPRTKRGLHVLFAGTLCLRKGIPYLGEAARRLSRNDIHIRAIGTPAISAVAMNSLKTMIDVPGNVPRSEMSGQYAWADVMVLPSISEGSANVCYEALAHGVPVITTPNSGSVIRDGREGFLVPIRDPEALADRMTRLADDRDLLRAFSDAAAARAKEYTREKYADRLTEAVASNAGTSRYNLDVPTLLTAAARN